MAASMDRLRDRWESISPREQRLVMALGITFVVVILVWVGLRISDGLAAIEKQNEDTRRALTALQIYRASDGTQAQDEELITADKPVRLETYLSSIADEVGIKIPGFKQRAPVTRDEFTETSTQIDLRNVTVHELKDFLEKVESRSRLVVIKELSIRRNRRDKERLEIVTMVIAAFSRAQAEGAGEAQEG